MATTVELELIAKTEQAQKDVANLTGKVDNLTESIDKTEDASKDLAKQNKATTKTAKGVSVATKAIGTALKAIGIGIIIALFAKLAEVFSKNQKVVDIFSNVTTTLSIAFNDLFSIFEGGLPSLNEIGTAIKKNIIERFNSMLKVTGLVGKALSKFFEGDFQGAMDAVKEAGVEAVDVLTGVDNSLGKITEYTKDIYEQAEATTALANASQLAEVRLQGLIEKYDLQAEQFRQIRDDERLTIKERIDANEALGKVLDEQREAQLKQAAISVASARAQIAATGDNIDNQVALQQALNELAATEAQVAGFRSEQLVNQAALEKELDEQRKERRETQVGLVELETVDPKVELALNTAAALDQIENDTTLKAADWARARENIARIEAENKSEALNSYANTLSDVSRLVGEETTAGKALAVASTLISTYLAAQQAYASQLAIPTPDAPIRAAIAAGVAVASGLANVKAILSVKTPSGGGGGGIGGGASAPQPPSFNVVGNSGVSQIGQTLNQEQEPIQAYVVSGNVTTQQELDRNIVDTATIG